MIIFRTITRTIAFGLFLAFLFIGIRLAFILYVGIHQNAMGEVGFEDIINTLINGAKYDDKTVAAATIIFLLLGILLSLFKFQGKVLNFYAGIIFFICIFLGIANMAFFGIYGNPFDNNILGLFGSDFDIILKTGLQGNFYIGTKIIIWIFCSIITFFIYKKFSNLFDRIFSKKLPLKYSIISSVIAFGILCAMIIIFINSHLGLNEISLDMNTKFSKDSFLKKITPGAFRNLYIVYKNNRSGLKYFYSKTPIEATKSFFNLPQNATPPFDLSILLEHTSTNSEKAPQIKHIFYIVSESLSDWNFDDEFDEIGLMSGLKSLVDGKHGFKIEHFVENANLTIRSLDVQITGLFNFDEALNSKAGIMPLFPTAIGGIMQKLGYETRFYYGGSEVWQQLDRYTQNEGFDKIFGNTYFLKYAQNKPYPKPLENVWGVYDPIMFDYLIDNSLASKNPTFNMVMTTSNHHPYDVDLKYYNVPMDKINTFLKTHIPKTELNLNDDVATILGHAYWYDKEVTKFIKKASKIFPQSLFIITGDHYGRMYVRNKLDERAGKSIPLIIYSPTLTPKQLYSVGSHIDIAPTIVELTSPKGFKYSSFGKPLFSNNHTNKYHSNGYALGYYVIENNRFIYSPEDGIEYFKNSKPKSDDKQEAKKLYERLEDARAISWWIFTNGNIIK